MANTNPPSAAEIIFNRANIALARSQRLVASWLPPQPSETSNSRRTENQKNDNDNAGDDDDDDENFTAVPERLGLGAPVPVKDAFNSLGSGTVSSNKLDDKLRQRLLGRNAKKFMQQQQQQQKQQTSTQWTGKDDATQRNGSGTKSIDDSDEDSDEGRTSLGRPRNPKPMKKSNQTQESKSIELDTEYLSTAGSDVDNMKSGNESKQDGDNVSVEAQHSTTATPVAAGSQQNKRRKIAKVSYLDEILQDRKKKKKRGNE